MKNRNNQAMIALTVLVITVILVWYYRRYTNNKFVEKYDTETKTDKEYILNKLKSEEILKPVLVMVSVSKLTQDKSVTQQAFDLATANKREELIKLVEGL